MDGRFRSAFLLFLLSLITVCFDCVEEVKARMPLRRSPRGMRSREGSRSMGGHEPVPSLRTAPDEGGVASAAAICGLSLSEPGVRIDA